MITLKLTPAQADELRWLLDSMNIDPAPPGKTLIEILDQPADHPLWPVLRQLRSVIALQLWLALVHNCEHSSTKTAPQRHSAATAYYCHLPYLRKGHRAQYPRWQAPALLQRCPQTAGDT